MNMIKNIILVILCGNAHFRHIPIYPFRIFLFVDFWDVYRLRKKPTPEKNKNKQKKLVHLGTTKDYE